MHRRVAFREGDGSAFAHAPSDRALRLDTCYHGGAFFEAIGDALRSLPYYRDRREVTPELRERLQSDLLALGWDVLPACVGLSAGR